MGQLYAITFPCRFYVIFWMVLSRTTPSFAQFEGCSSDAVQRAMTDFKQCADYINQLLLSINYNEVNYYTVQQRCTRTPLSCRESAERYLGGCLEYNQREALRTLYLALEAGHGYWCSENGRRLMDFYNQRGPDCFFTQRSMLNNCEVEYPLTNIYLKTYDAEYCRVTGGVVECLQQVYERCLAYESPEVIRGYYNAFWKVTNCDYTLTNSAAQTSNTVISLLVGLLAIGINILINIHL